jgi:hypothetical protein
MERLVACDLETVPDLTLGRLALGLEAAMPDDAARAALGEHYARPGEAPEFAFVKAPLHRIVCIGVLVAEAESAERGWVVTRTASHTAPTAAEEAALLRRFLRLLAPRPGEGRGPLLLGFNSRGFDLPVLRYRALALALAAPALWGGNGRDYDRRYPDWKTGTLDHLDLCDLLSGHGASARPAMPEAAALLGLPGKPAGIDGRSVEGLVAAGRWEDIARYCASDVALTFRLFLRWETARGRPAEAEASALAGLEGIDVPHQRSRSSEAL